jgi:hypothetical protein
MSAVGCIFGDHATSCVWIELQKNLNETLSDAQRQGIVRAPLSSPPEYQSDNGSAFTSSVLVVGVAASDCELTWGDRSNSK